MSLGLELPAPVFVLVEVAIFGLNSDLKLEFIIQVLLKNRFI